jgi:hypothetical protein
MTPLIRLDHGRRRWGTLVFVVVTSIGATLWFHSAAGQTPDSGNGTPIGIVGSAADPAGTISCPAGSYVAGITAWKSSPATRYCVGCLTGIQIICKPLGH